MRLPHALCPPRLSILGLLTLLAYANSQSQKHLLCKHPSTRNCVIWQVNLREDGISANTPITTKIPQFCGFSDKQLNSSREKYMKVKQIEKNGLLKNIFCNKVILLGRLFDWKEVENTLSTHTRVRRQSFIPRGRYRGQTQSQYLAIDRGNGKDEGRAEAHSAADTSRASVSGNSGMGQAQSQSIYDPNCDDCHGKSNHEVENLKRPVGYQPEGSTYGSNIGSNWPSNDRFETIQPTGPNTSGIIGYRPNGATTGRYTPPVFGGSVYTPGGSPTNNRYGSFGNTGTVPNEVSNRYEPQANSGTGKTRPGDYISPEAEGNAGLRPGEISVRNKYGPGTNTNDFKPAVSPNGFRPDVAITRSPGRDNYLPNQGNIFSHRQGDSQTGPGGNLPQNGIYGPDQTSYGNQPTQSESGGIVGTSPINTGYNPTHVGTNYSPGFGSQAPGGVYGPMKEIPTGFGTVQGGIPSTNWPMASGLYQGPGGTVFCCAIPNNGVGNVYQNNYEAGKRVPNLNGGQKAYFGQIPYGGYYKTGLDGSGPFNLGQQYGMPGVTTAPGTQYGPNTSPGSSIPGSQYIPGGSSAPGGTYITGGAGSPSASGGQYLPGGVGGSLVPGGQYTPGGNNGSPMSGGQYIPGGTGSSAVPGGQYTPGGVDSSLLPGNQYIPGGPRNTGRTSIPGGHYIPDSTSGLSIPGGQYIPGGTSVSTVPGGQYTPGGTGISSGPGGQYIPGASSGSTTPGGQYTTTGTGVSLGSGGQYIPGSSSGSTVPGGQYIPGSTGVSLGPKGQYVPSGSGGSTAPGGVYVPSGTGGYLGPQGQYIPGGTDGYAVPGTHYTTGVGGSTIPGGQYFPGGSSSSTVPGGEYIPGGTRGPNGSGSSLVPGGQYIPDGSSVPEGQYIPGGSSIPGGTYIPGGSVPGGQYVPGGVGGTRVPGGQYIPGDSSVPGGTYIPGGSVPGRQYVPEGVGSTTVPGGQYVPGEIRGGPGFVSGTSVPQGQYIPGSTDSGINVPGNQYEPSGTGSTTVPGQYIPGGSGVDALPRGQYGSVNTGGSAVPGYQGKLPSSGGRYDKSQQEYHNQGDSRGQGNEYNGIPQNYLDPNTAITDEDDSEAEANVAQNVNGTTASASSKGGNDKGRAQTSVQGTYTGSGSFQAQAQITGENKEAQSEVSGGKKGASSSASGSGRNNKSQANVQLGSETGSVQTQSQSNGVMHSSNSQVQGSVKGGMADAQARGPGSTSSQAQIGFTPYKDEEKVRHDLQHIPFTGGGMASAQSSGRTGQSQTQLHGTFKYGITYNGAAQSGASLDKDAVFPNRLSFEKINVFDEKNKNIDVDKINTDTTETPQALDAEIPSLETSTLPESNNANEKNDIPTTENGIDESMKNSESRYSGHAHIDHHVLEAFNSTNSSGPTSIGSRRSFQTNYGNIPDYEFTTDKEETQPEYETDVGYEGDGNDATDVEQNEYSNYDEYTKDSPTHQYLQSSNRKGLEVRQTTGGNTQHILLGSLKDHNAEIIQKDTERPDENKVYQPGERVPGTGGYTIPVGFTGSVKSIASKDKTYVVGSKEYPSQAQTVTLTPGTGKIKYTHPSSYGKYVKPKNLRSLHSPKENDNRYVSVSKSVTRALDSDNNIRKQYSHTYYTKSSSCGYFTFTCTMVSSAEGRKKVCKPKMPTNPDGTPIRC